MLDIKSLKNAFSNISEIGKGEETFTLNNTSITIALLLPKDETEVQKLSAQVYAEEIKETPDTNVATSRYLETFKLAVLSYAIVQVGEYDLRGLDFVPTGDVLPNGKQVKITKFKAMRDLLLTFSRKAVDNIFQRYNDLSTTTEIQSEKLLEYEPLDLSEEINTLEERLSELKKKQEHSDAFAKKKSEVEILGDTDSDTDSENSEDQKHDNLEQVTENQEPNTVQETAPHPTPPVQDQSPRQRVTPQKAPPPQQKVQAQEMSKEKVMETLQSSFVDREENEPFPPSALDKEHERLNKMRQSSTQQHRKPPHMRAKKTMETVSSDGAMTDPVGQLDGVPVYRTTEPQEIGRSVHNATEGIGIDSQPLSSKNPRFRG